MIITKSNKLNICKMFRLGMRISQNLSIDVCGTFSKYCLMDPVEKYIVKLHFALDFQF